MAEKFDKKKYDIEYINTHKRHLNVKLNIKELEELEELLKKKNMTKVQFVRNAIEELKKK